MAANLILKKLLTTYSLSCIRAKEIQSYLSLNAPSLLFENILRVTHRIINYLISKHRVFESETNLPYRLATVIEEFFNFEEHISLSIVNSFKISFEFSCFANIWTRTRTAFKICIFFTLMNSPNFYPFLTHKYSFLVLPF